MDGRESNGALSPDEVFQVQLQQLVGSITPQNVIDALRAYVWVDLTQKGEKPEDIAEVLKDDTSLGQYLSLSWLRFAARMCRAAWAQTDESGAVCVPSEVRKVLVKLTDEELEGLRRSFGQELKRRGAKRTPKVNTAYALYVEALERGLKDHDAWESVWAHRSMKGFWAQYDKKNIRNAVKARLRRERSEQPRSSEGNC